MKRINATSETSKQALNLVTSMQSFFAEKLENLSLSFEKKKKFEAIEWFRNQGHNGGGLRLVVEDSAVFNRASINVPRSNMRIFLKKAKCSDSFIDYYPPNESSRPIDTYAYQLDGVEGWQGNLACYGRP